MKLYLASVIEHWNAIHPVQDFLSDNDLTDNVDKKCHYNWGEIYVLESFYYIKNNAYFSILQENKCDILLDSGAFSFIMNKDVYKVDWDSYIEEYAEFIVKYNIDKFLELDIESVIGMKETERLREKLELLTGKKSIPVWHVCRGIDYFKWMCMNYDYVAFGGLMSDGYSRKQLEKVFPWFIKIAHDNNTKIHALGWTPTDSRMLLKYNFDSCDSSSWVCGNRFGTIYRFDYSSGVIRKHIKQKSQRMKAKESAENNFSEWVKYQQYVKNITHE